MGVEFSAEKRLLAENELDPVQLSHYPDLAELAQSELVELARFLRARRDRAHHLIRDLRRARRGKGAGDAGLTSERGLTAKKQVFARAVKRVNARHATVVAELKRQRALEAMRGALSRLHAADRDHPGRGTGRGHTGMSSRPNRQPRPIIHGARVGTASQAGRVAQAIRDAR